MILAALLLASATAVPAATPAPAPRPSPALGRTAEGARPKTLSEHAAEMKAKGAPARRVSFDDVRRGDPADAVPAKGGKAGPDGTAAGNAVGGSAPADAGAAEAQRRMDRAVRRGLDVPERTSTSRRDRARAEWDDAAEACRRTPGCVPQYRDDATYGANKPLKTDQELIEDVRTRGFSEPHPLPK